MSVLEFFQRVIAFFLLMMAVGVLYNILLFPLTWVFWKIARYPFESSSNDGFWVW